jgi:GNAT superfamily N-acetyltransferase
MKIVLTESQYQKVVDEIKTYKYKEPSFKGDPHEKYKDIVSTNTKVKSVGPYTYYYEVMDEYGTPTYIFNVVDNVNKEYVGYGAFDVKYGNDFYVNFPFIRKKYRGQGIGKEMYKTILNGGNLISGSEQSEFAIKLWKSLYKDFPNMKFIDDKGKEHPVYLKNDELYTKDDQKVYDDKEGKSFLKIPKQ